MSLRSGLVSARGGAVTGADPESSIDAAFAGSHAIDATQPAALAAWQHQAEDSLVDVSWLFSGDISYHVLVDSSFGDLSGGLALSRGLDAPGGNRPVLGRRFARAGRVLKARNATASPENARAIAPGSLDR